MWMYETYIWIAVVLFAGFIICQKNKNKNNDLSLAASEKLMKSQATIFVLMNGDLEYGPMSLS